MIQVFVPTGTILTGYLNYPETVKADLYLNWIIRKYAANHCNKS